MSILHEVLLGGTPPPAFAENQYIYQTLSEAVDLCTLTGPLVCERVCTVKANRCLRLFEPKIGSPACEILWEVCEPLELLLSSRICSEYSPHPQTSMPGLGRDYLLDLEDPATWKRLRLWICSRDASHSCSLSILRKWLLGKVFDHTPAIRPTICPIEAMLYTQSQTNIGPTSQRKLLDTIV